MDPSMWNARAEVNMKSIAEVYDDELGLPCNVGAAERRRRPPRAHVPAEPLEGRALDGARWPAELDLHDGLS
jgi:hypothetical protein